MVLEETQWQFITITVAKWKVVLRGHSHPMLFHG
jgi:hypothetical protein